MLHMYEKKPFLWLCCVLLISLEEIKVHNPLYYIQCSVKEKMNTLLQKDTVEPYARIFFR